MPQVSGNLYLLHPRSVFHPFFLSSHSLTAYRGAVPFPPCCCISFSASTYFSVLHLYRCHLLSCSIRLDIASSRGRAYLLILSSYLGLAGLPFFLYFLYPLYRPTSLFRYPSVCLLLTRYRPSLMSEACIFFFVYLSLSITRFHLYLPSIFCINSINISSSLFLVNFHLL